MEPVRAAAHVSWDDAVTFATDAFAATGVPEQDARKAAEAIVDADLHGTVTHGLKNLRNYVSQLLDKRVNPEPNMRDIGGAKAARILTADNGLGHVAGHKGMEAAIELAKTYGVGTVFVRDSNHYGASGYWARLPLKHSMVGFAFTTASPRVAPWGGRQGIVGNNPPAWAVPTQLGETRDSVFLDIALSVVAGNRIDIFRRRNEAIPDGWALDKDGNPTTDPLQATDGTYAPVGDYKGSGMAIVLAMINSLLAGAAFDDQRPGMYGSTNHWFAAYDIAQFTDAATFTEEAQNVRDRIQSNPPRPGFERVYAPGDLENANVRRNLADGIPFEQFTLDELAWVAEHTGVALPRRLESRT